MILGLFSFTSLSAEFPRKPSSEYSSDYWQFWFLYQTEKRDGESEIVVRPFFSTYKEKKSAYEFNTLIYPLYYDESTTHWGIWTFLYLFSGSSTKHPDLGEDKDFISPLVLYGEGDIAKENYWGIFPLYGEIHNKFAWSDLDFVLFPMYTSWSYEDFRAYSILWPIFLYGSSPVRKEFRFWPFYSAKEHQGKYARYSIIWPFIQWGYEDLDAKEPRSFVFLPGLYVGKDSQFGNMKSRGIFWLPLLGSFLGYGYDRRTDQFDFNALFFFFQYGYSNDRDYRKFVFYPFFVYSHYASKESTFITPFYLHMQTDTFYLKSDRYYFIPLYIDVHYSYPALHKETQYYKFWPFFRYHKDKDGNLTWNTLSLFPLKSETVEHFWSPIWSIVQYQKMINGEKRLSLLMRLYTQRWTEDEFHMYVPLLLDMDLTKKKSEWEILYGLFGYKNEENERTVKLLWLIEI